MNTATFDVLCKVKEIIKCAQEKKVLKNDVF